MCTLHHLSHYYYVARLDLLGLMSKKRRIIPLAIDWIFLPGQAVDRVESTQLPASVLLYLFGHVMCSFYFSERIFADLLPPLQSFGFKIDIDQFQQTAYHCCWRQTKEW